MALDADKEIVYQALLDKFKTDLMPTHILPMSSVGLIQMTRKRITESSVQKYFQSCPCCHIKSGILAPHVLLLKFLEQLEHVSPLEGASLVISARQDLLTCIKNQEEKWKKHSQLEDMSWKYSPIQGYHNQVNLSVSR
jgi:ribonuclease G